MRPGPSPLVGYNTNVRHKGKLYHIQTEDSGVNHPHVITHLFADGGRIIASRKTGYAEHLGSKEVQSIVKRLMQDQHKAIFIELRDCVYDEDVTTTPVTAPDGAAPAAAQQSEQPPSESQTAQRVAAAPAAGLDVDTLERAAEARVAESVTAKSRAEAPRRGAGRYQQTVPAQATRIRSTRPPATPSIFGGEIMQGKSLDEVILSYLSDDVGEPEP